MKLILSQQSVEKYSNIKYHEISSTESRVVSCGRTDGQRDMTKVIVAFQNSVNAPKNGKLSLRGSS
jgi:hypothetical protein